MQGLNRYLTEKWNENEPVCLPGIQTNGKELNPEINPYICGQLIFNKGTNTIQ